MLKNNQVLLWQCGVRIVKVGKFVVKVIPECLLTDRHLTCNIDLATEYILFMFQVTVMVVINVEQLLRFQLNCVAKSLDQQVPPDCILPEGERGGILGFFFLRDAFLLLEGHR